MSALNIREIGAERKAALEAEARVQGLSVAELVRRIVDDGLARATAARAREAWLAAARPGLAYEAEDLARRGPSLARHRRLPGIGSDPGA